ncbi:serine threonine- kinase endoribonuclease IRE1 [Paramuricea clavata]|uniref:Serine threonine- kinase endoribonuclease IRE1 n=1 Tax=Paramuricea clavata TaxID=317549 RepID=A0A6S7JT98_PARCT|nr:serine threonine- kinase endoribonuclease IRE1 [Paramuricea clavata]
MAFLACYFACYHSMTCHIEMAFPSFSLTIYSFLFLIQILFYFREESTLTTGRKEEIFENDKVFVEGISTKTSKDSLKYYMERISGLPVKDITYGTKSSDSVNAVGKFHSTVASNTEVQWTERSIKHGSKLSEFVELLKANPSKATQIGTYRVCFDDKFSIGEGSEGTKVYVGLSDDGFEVAVKCMDLKKCRQMGDHEKKILTCQKVRKEAHIVNYRFFHQPDGSKTAYLVLDLHEESLRDYVLNEERSTEQLRNEGSSIICQILYGVKTLHCGNPEILHRDLKPSNILVTVEGEMVLADFGISRTLPKEQTTYRSGVRGTEGWMAVESLPNEDDDDDYLSYEDIQVRYKKQSDIQVVGMLCYYVLTKGKHPYGTRVHRNSNISKGSFDLKDLSDPCAKDLIAWMLQHDLRKRPNFHKCLKHPYLRTDEENFNFVTRVGNEKEIKTKDTTSIVVQELNKLPGLTNWLSVIETWVMNFMTARRTAYTNDVADLLRFMRNMATHWRDKTPPANVQTTVVTPQEYFERKFPTLAVELHQVIRGQSDWTAREGLKGYF